MKYGVQRLVAINSGRFLYADVDLSKPVHLSAPNNAGKSTLVNALQFLYVDDVDRMAFARRSVEDTREHYFGADPSYLVFECATPKGTQTLLVRGMGRLRSARFERYVYAGGYSRADFEDESGTILSFDDVKARLADRALQEVPKVHLWEVLAGRTGLNGKPLPALGILPVRNRAEYRSFREVFVKLLSLANVNARDLRRLIIACHAPETGKRRIDVAAGYKQHFDRAVRSEEELRFIAAISEMIDRGHELRTRIAARGNQLATQAPRLWDEALTSRQHLGNRLAVLADRRRQARQNRGRSNEALAEANRDLGRLQAAFDEALRRLSELDDRHRHWSSYPAEVLDARQKNRTALEDEISRLRRNLDETLELDVSALRRRVADLERQIAADRGLIAAAGKTAAAFLLEHGFRREQLDGIFRILNPALLSQVLDESLTLRDPSRVLARLHDFAARIENGVYADESVEVRLDRVPAPDWEALFDRARLEQEVLVKETDLTAAQERLRVAADREQARRELEARQRELEQRTGEIEAYRRYLADWAARHTLEAAVTDQENRIEAAKVQLARLETQVETLRQEEEHCEDEERRIRSCSWNDALRAFSAEAAKLQMELSQPALQELSPIAPDESDAGQAVATAEGIMRRMERWRAHAAELVGLTTELRALERKIEAASSQTRLHQVYFDEPDFVWQELIEKRQSQPEREQVVKREWDDLFTLLTSDLKLMLAGLQNVQSAVRRFNRALASYRVSNLQNVDVSVVHRRDTYGAVEALTREGAQLADPDRIEAAKKRVQTLIETGEVIELENLFEIRIRVTENDGRRHEVNSLDDIGSTGTGMTVKAMIFIQLVRALLRSDEAALHFYLDETGQLDDHNLYATTEMAVLRSMVPITAQPGVRMEPLAHPEVTVYTLGADRGRFCIDGYQSFHARRTQSLRTEAPIGDGHVIPAS